MPADTGVYDKAGSKRFSGGQHDVGLAHLAEIRTLARSVRPDADGALRLTNHALEPDLLPPPSLVLTGISNSDNQALFGAQIVPPDTNGDVGPNHYVQVVNLAIRIFNKSGTPLTNAVKLSTIFAPLGTPASLRDDGAPTALYDPMADRWLISQYAYPTGTTTPPYHQLIAISKTPDPTGAYYLYDFVISEGNNEFPASPQFGVWPDGYYMSTTQVLNGSSADGGGAFAFDRIKMLAGDRRVGFIYFNRNLASFPEGQAGMLPADMDGVRPPPAGAPCPFAYFTANEFGAPADGMRIFDFRADFNTPANSTFTERVESAAAPLVGIPVAPFNPLSPSGQSDIPQSSTTRRLDSISDRLMRRLQYINFATHESLIVNHTVNVGSDDAANYRAGIRYYQFRKNAGNNPYTVFEQGTYAGAAGDMTHRWMGSAAMNAAGDLAVGYSASSASIFPSIRYAARYSGDPAGSLAQGEQEIFTGTGAQTGSSRWGDYSNLSLDPADDTTFWYTQETYAVTSPTGWTTKVAKLNVGGANTPFPKGTVSGTITSCANNQPIAGATVRTNTGFFTTTDANGSYTLPKMAPDTVSVIAAKDGSAATAGNVVVTNGNTTAVNLCVVPVNMIVKGASGVSAGPNGMLDPGERVTVFLNVQNVGGPGACTTALTGTLQSTGGVTNPTPVAQNYGVTCAGNAPVGRSFTFTVDPTLSCGSVVTATLVMTDGAANYGSLTYTFPTGTANVRLTENFDGLAAPALPAGWTSTFSGSGTAWTTSTDLPDTAPNAAFGPQSASIGLSELTTPSIAITSSDARLKFRNSFNTEAVYDGMVLEISINGGAFTDIVAAGGSFTAGGYNSTLSSSFGNPLGGRMAWSGLSGGSAAAPAYIDSSVNLPASAAGQNIRLRWSVGSDSGFAPATNAGARIDTISVIDGFNCAPVPVSTVSRKIHNGLTYDIALPAAGPLGIECRTSQGTNDHLVVVTFLNAVNGQPQAHVSGSAAIGSGGVPNGGAVTVNGSTVTVPLTNVADAQHLAITLSDVNSGGAVGVVGIRMGVLIGDVNSSGNVSASDTGQVKAQVGPAGPTTFRSDVTPNGSINATDISFVKSRSGNSIP